MDPGTRVRHLVTGQEMVIERAVNKEWVVCVLESPYVIHINTRITKKICRKINIELIHEFSDSPRTPQSENQLVK